MSVELDPVELGFKRTPPQSHAQSNSNANSNTGPFDHEVSQVLRLRNPNSDPVAFKVKTTAPKQYATTRNYGLE
jgi:hypothetical protein